jgi:hypothetical protein
MPIGQEIRYRIGLIDRTIETANAMASTGLMSVGESSGNNVVFESGPGGSMIC